MRIGRGVVTGWGEEGVDNGEAIDDAESGFAESLRRHLSLCVSNGIWVPRASVSV